MYGIFIGTFVCPFIGSLIGPGIDMFIAYEGDNPLLVRNGGREAGIAASVDSATVVFTVLTVLTALAVLAVTVSELLEILADAMTAIEFGIADDEIY